ncbi:hypothetical protein HPHPH28_1017 [Helicobacter pylori Hp H-28]|nr:hypothetical protein HPHPH28_1017 [Helicobacter pylori Hp H-28]
MHLNALSKNSTPPKTHKNAFFQPTYILIGLSLFIASC